MKRERLVFVFFLLVAALLGFGLGWWTRGSRSVEHRARATAERMREAVRSLTH